MATKAKRTYEFLTLHVLVPADVADDEVLSYAQHWAESECSDGDYDDEFGASYDKVKAVNRPDGVDTIWRVVYNRPAREQGDGTWDETEKFMCIGEYDPEAHYDHLIGVE